MNPMSKETLQRQFMLTNYIGLAMIGSVFVYAVVVFGIDRGYIPVSPPPNPNLEVFTTLKYILLFVSIVIYFIISFIQKIFAKSVRSLTTASIIVFALSEAVSIYGLVLFILTRNSTNFFIFMAISLFYFYHFYPKYEQWEQLLNQELQANPSN